MDFVERAPTIDHFWSPESLREWISKCQFHTVGHKPRCKCDWCFSIESLTIILENRPDLVHGGHCEERCYHVRYCEKAQARYAERKRSSSSSK